MALSNYNLSQKDQEKIQYIVGLAKLSLTKLNIRFTSPYLKETILQSYIRILEAPVIDSEEQDLPCIADKADPSNLIIVLLDALKKYHIKNEVSDSFVLNENTETLIILTPSEKKEDYTKLLGIIEHTYLHELRIISGNKMELSVDITENKVENYVLLKKSAFSGEPAYALNNTRKWVQQIIIWLSIAFVTIFLITGLYNAIQNYSTVMWAPLLLLLASGIFISYHLFMLDKINAYANGLVKKVCSNNRKGYDCQTVLSSDAAKVLGLASMTDIGIIYFCSLMIYATFGLFSNHYSNYLGLLFWCSAIPLPYTLFSVYYQIKVVKKICVFCLAIQILFWIQFGYFILISNNISFLSINFRASVPLLIITVMVSAFYFLYLEYRKHKISSVWLLLRDMKTKNDPGYFDLLSQRQTKFNKAMPPGALVVGDQDSPVKLTAILSLSCVPCAEKLKELLKLSDWFDHGIHLTILIKTEEDAKDLLKNILHDTLTNNTAQALTQLNAWYSLLSNEKKRGNMILNDIMNKWKKEQGAQNRREEVEVVYSLQEEWFKEQLISQTPLLAFNEHYLAKEYYDTNLFSSIIERKLE